MVLSSVDRLADHCELAIMEAIAVKSKDAIEKLVEELKDAAAGPKALLLDDDDAKEEIQRIIDCVDPIVRILSSVDPTLGASSYTYAEARWSETLRDWIAAPVNALNFLGGVPKAAVPDNLKAGIKKPSRYEPGVNRTYQDLADHYGFVVLPARVRRPRNKAKIHEDSRTR
jgi:transposase